MSTLVRAARLLAVVASAALLAGCSTTTASPSPAPMSVVTGTMTCEDLEFASPAPAANDITAIRDGKGTCTEKASDVRVSGTRTDSWNMDVYDPDGAKARVVQWGTSTITGPKGTWEGTASGTAALPEWGDIITTWYKGTGEYAGLSYFELVTGKGPWRIQGQIFTGEPPTSPSASPTQ